MKTPVSSCILSSALVLGASAQADPAAPATPAPVAAPAAVPAPTSAPAPSEADALRLHKLAEGWLSVGAVPEKSASEVWAGKAVGVVVTLRLEGVTMGEGSAMPADLGAVLDGRPAAPVDLVPLLAQASRTAFARAEARLSETAGPAKDLLAGMGKTLCVDVQLGHSPAPVLLGAQGGAGEVFAQVLPGWHGLALRAAGDTQPSLAWPGTQAAAGVPVDTSVARLLVEQHVTEAEGKKLARPGGPRLSSFEVFHVVRTRPGFPPMSLSRGAVVVPENAVSRDSLVLASEQVARHLIMKIKADGVLRGGYLPAQDLWQPAAASPSETALVAYALVRFAARRMAVDPKDDIAQKSVLAASAMARQLAPQVSDSKAAPQPLAAAFLLMALTDAPGGADRDWRDRLAAGLMALDAGEGAASGYAVRPLVATADGSTQLSPPWSAKPVGEGTAAIITCALSGWYERTRDAKAEAVVRRQLALAFAHAGETDAAESPYWLALAERRAGLLLAAADKDPAAARAEHVRRLQKLGKNLSQMRQSQIVRRPETGPADLVGGFSFTPGLAMPTWRGAFPMALWGQLLQDPDAGATGQPAADMLGFGRGARFMLQLVVTPASCFAVRQPAAAVGGVRGAPWEMRLDTQPAAMSLLALEEAIEAVEAAAKR